MNEEPTKPKRAPRPKDAAKQIEIAQLSIVETALIGFVEQLEGKVVTDDVILAKGQHITLAPDGPFSVFKKDDRSFHQFYCWGRKEVVALGFLDPQKPLVLFIVRLREEDWPVALRLFLEQKKEGA